MLHRACAYLWSVQDEDGGWHSETHGLVKEGQAWTPFILSALLDVPDSIYNPGGRIDDAIDFVVEHVNERGVLGLSDPDIIEYPNYSTAYALIALKKAAYPDEELMARMSGYLLSEQFTEPRGISPDHVAYGSWGMGETNLKPGQIGHVDLSHTRRVLQALHTAGIKDREVSLKANEFLKVVQKHPDASSQPGLDRRDTVGEFFDGGFYYSPTAEGTNKAGQVYDSTTSEYVNRSYATTTCDGLMSLLYGGVPRENERVQAAIRWLKDNPGLEEPAGIPEDDPGGWRRVIFFYHLMVRAEAYTLLGSSENWGSWRQEMLGILKPKQSADGSFSNPEGAINKEDDPMLATAMAVIVLTSILGHN
jgi:squalene-hopene/tetraprenyl-beta-curcumene cyclase